MSGGSTDGATAATCTMQAIALENLQLRLRRLLRPRSCRVHQQQQQQGRGCRSLLQLHLHLEAMLLQVLHCRWLHCNSSSSNINNSINKGSDEGGAGHESNAGVPGNEAPMQDSLQSRFYCTIDFEF
ncbi:uncharacterized protein [Physcomitrium patens]|uniref:uncharacterized protein isoform X2 n=1 Tax=Physcomitrium patens TaxID=3218 RepID=UPI003CCD187F